MFECQLCGARFYPVGTAWGNQACGDCIAAQIEMLLAPVPAAQRKPMRRAASEQGSAENSKAAEDVVQPSDRRSA